MAQLKTYNIRQIELLQSLADISSHHCPILDGIPAASVQKLAVLPFQIGVCFPQFFQAIAYPAPVGGAGRGSCRCRRWRVVFGFVLGRTGKEAENSEACLDLRKNVEILSERFNAPLIKNVPL